MSEHRTDVPAAAAAVRAVLDAQVLALLDAAGDELPARLASLRARSKAAGGHGDGLSAALYARLALLAIECERAAILAAAAARDL